MNFIVIEDELLTAQRIQAIIEKSFPTFKCLALIESVSQGIKWFEHNKEPDLIFSDIQLGDGISFEIFEQQNISAPIIFITAYNEYAIKAFEHNSIDYLLKPIKRIDIVHSVNKFKKNVLQSINSSIAKKFLTSMISAMKNNSKRSFLAKSGNSFLPIPFKEIVFFYSECNITYVQTIENKKLSLDYSLDQLEEILDKELFFRISRQFIIKKNNIKKVDKLIGNRLLVTLCCNINHELIVSRRKVKAFKAFMHV